MSPSDPSDPTLGLPSASMPPTAAAVYLREGPGAHVGPYKLRQLIGEGGFGSVFMAQQDRPVQRVVALKIIKLGMDTKQVVARFEQERQALAMMDHPHIARVLDAGTTDAGRPFFVMELVKGDPIVAYCDKGNLSVDERLDLFAQVCAAVQHAHGKGIIHRDLKPSNILVSSVDGVAQAKIIDFGIAKATGAQLTDKTLVTEFRQLIGTPVYMSPEQAEGSLDIDTRSDVYALGVLLYELLTGSTPFDADALRSSPLAEIQRVIREVDPPLPSTRLARTTDTLGAIAAHRHVEPRKLCILVRGDLDWIVMRAIEKDRTRRYETAAALATDLRRHRAGETVVAAPPSRAYKVRKFARRNRGVVFAGSAVAAALLVGAVGFAWQARRAGLQRDLALKAQASEALERDKAERVAYQAQVVSAANAVEEQRMDAAGAHLNATAPRLRGWEYRHLVGQLDRSLPLPFPASWRVDTLDASADGTVLAVRRTGGGTPGWIVLDADLRTERLRLPLTEVGNVAVSPDGLRVAWIPDGPGDPNPATLWSAETGKPVATLKFDAAPVGRPGRRVTWRADGERFAVARQGAVEVFDGHTGELIVRKDLSGWVLFTGDRRWALQRGWRPVSDFDSRAFRVLDAETLEPRSDVMRFDSAFGHLATSSWHSRLAFACDDGTLRLVDIGDDGTPRLRTSIAAGINVLGMPAWSRDGTIAADGSFRGRTRIWDSTSGAMLGDFAGPQAPIGGLAFLRDLRAFLAVDLEGNARMWPAAGGSPGVLAAGRGFVYPVVVSTDGSLLLTGSWDGASGLRGGLKVWDARTGARVAEIGSAGDVFWSAALTPDARHALAGIWREREADCRIDVIDLRTGAVSTSFRPPGLGQPQRIAVHPDGRRVLSTYGVGMALVWDLVTGEALRKTDLHHRPDHPNPSFAAAISPDGRLLALADGDVGIRLVNADTYVDVRNWDAHKEAIWSLSFSPDGKWLLSASEDDTVGVWEVATGKLVARLAGHNADVLCAAVSPDGTRIASGGRDGYVRLWDTVHFENVAQLGGHKDYIYSLAWSPDGQCIFTGGGDNTVRTWDTRTLAERIGDTRARAEALPPIEARVAKTRLLMTDPAKALETVVASPDLTPRQRELARQVAARFSTRGTPAYYQAPRATTPITIDGKLDEAAWSAAPWSEPFVDIEGDAKPKPRFQTLMRMLWDDKYLYVAARMEEPHVWGTLRNRDDIVFRDNDFEVFLDPNGTGRWYGEVEVNALGTIFDLRLDRPYSESGMPHHEWSPPGMRVGVTVDGTLNDPSDTDRGWTAEIAIPYSGLADHATVPMPPRPGNVWRINFSRVEWKHDVVNGQYVKRPNTPEDNWAWTPQHMVDMHRPREWGFVEFLPAPQRPKSQDDLRR